MFCNVQYCTSVLRQPFTFTSLQIPKLVLLKRQPRSVWVPFHMQAHSVQQAAFKCLVVVREAQLSSNVGEGCDLNT